MNVYKASESDDWYEFWLDIASGDTSRIASALVHSSLGEPETEPVEFAALSLLNASSYGVREAALCALGHLACPRKRITQLQAVLEALERFEQYPEHRGRLNDVISDFIAGGYIPKPPDPYAEMVVTDSQGNVYRKGDDGFWLSQEPVRLDASGGPIWREYYREGTVLTLVAEWNAEGDHAAGPGEEKQGDKRIPLPEPDPNFYAPLPSPGAH